MSQHPFLWNKCTTGNETRFPKINLLGQSYMIAKYLGNLQISHKKIRLQRSKTKHAKMYDQHVMTSCSTSCCDTSFNKIDANHKNTELTISPFGKFWLKQPWHHITGEKIKQQQ